MAHPNSTQNQYVALTTSTTSCSPSEIEHLSPGYLVDQQPPSSDHSNSALSGTRSATHSDITDETSTPLAGFGREKDIAEQEPPEVVRQHIHWLSPTLMIGTFLAGVLLAVGHHLYYQSLRGQRVGNSQRQQWALRLGNLFAFLVKSCLATSAGIAYIQWLWKTLRCKYMTIRGIDAAFAVRGNLLSFFDWEMLSKFKIGTLIALVLWCIPFVALVTPATLSVEASSQRITTPENVANLDISNFLPLNASTSDDKAWQFVDRFAEVSVNGDPLSDSTPYVVSGTSNRLARLVAASASSGEILPITNPLPGLNATYQIRPYLPALKCETSTEAVALNTTIAAVISASLKTSETPFNSSQLDMRQLAYGLGGQILKTYIGYFAMVPQYNDSSRPVPMESLDTEKMVTSQLWVAIADHAEDGSTIPRFFTCQLWNASISLNISYLNDVQTVRHDHLTYINEIDPTTIVHDHEIPRNMASMSCEAFFWELCQQLVGVIGFSPELDLINNANIRDTTLTRASEFAAIFNIFTAMEHGVILNNKSMADMAHGLMLDNKNISQIGTSTLNKSLDVLIEEFALNASLNLLTDSVLSALTSAEITHSISQNIYTYDPYNLILAYGLAIFFTLLIILLGGLAYRSNGLSYEHSISSIIGTTQTTDLAMLFQRQSGGAQPLDPHIASTKLRFGVVVPVDGDQGSGQREPRVAFGIEGTVTAIGRR